MMMMMIRLSLLPLLFWN